MTGLRGAARLSTVRRGAGAAFLIAFLVLASACGAAEVPVVDAADAELQQGRDIWIARCNSCHQGAGPVLWSGGFEPAAPELQAQVIAAGGNGMPGFGEVLDDDDLAAVTRFAIEVGRMKPDSP